MAILTLLFVSKRHLVIFQSIFRQILLCNSWSRDLEKTALWLAVLDKGRMLLSSDWSIPSIAQYRVYSTSHLSLNNLFFFVLWPGNKETRIIIILLFKILLKIVKMILYRTDCSLLTFFFMGWKKSISDLLILLSSDILVLDFTKTLKTKKNMDDNLSLKMVIYFL